jgi:hypothetical protein
MKVVLRHIATGRYYRSPGKWVRRADNALAFEDVGMALQFSRLHQVEQTQPVHRLAPYLMPLLRRPDHSMWEAWTSTRGNGWYLEHTEKFLRN